jgi:hypothetical protein
MKNFIKSTVAMAFATVSVASMAQSRIPVTINGDPVHFHGQGPVMSGSRVLVPLRGVLEKMGATVEWDPQDQMVRADKDGTKVRLHIGERQASVNGQTVTLDVPAQIIDGSTMVPLRFVGEAIGEQVQWDADQQMVEITTGFNVDQNQTLDQQRDQDRDQSRAERVDRPNMLSAGTVIPATMDATISSRNSSPGDKVTADVADGADGLPSGTQLSGYVARVNPNWIEVRFTQLVMPSGRAVRINATMVQRSGNA